MVIKIEIDDKKCAKLLEVNDYVTEDVMAYYHTSTNPYNEDDDISDLNSIEITVAFKRGERPAILDKRYPMLGSLKEYGYENVINRLYNERLNSVILNV